MKLPPNDLARTVFLVLSISILIGASFWILRPFLAATIWATTIVVSTWPLMKAVEARVWHQRWLATTVMLLALLLVFFVPFGLAVITILENSDRIADAFRWVSQIKLSVPPDWLNGLPLIGDRAAVLWQQVVAQGGGPLLKQLGTHAGTLTKWLVGEVGGIGVLSVQFMLTVAISGLLYAYGESAASRLRAFVRRLAPTQGDHVMTLSAGAIRGVAMGVVVTALIQATLGGIGLAIAGVPLAALLTAVMFMLTVAQIGTLPVLVPAVVWLYWSGDTTWGTVLLVWTAVVGTMDNFVRPWLIRKGADLPLILIFVGVVGGLIAFGLVGLFVGPVVLAVAYRLLDSWVQQEPVEPGTEPIRRD